jgi:hypothetical protein
MSVGIWAILGRHSQVTAAVLVGKLLQCKIAVLALEGGSPCS